MSERKSATASVKRAGGIEIDDSGWPLVRVTWPAEPVKDQDVDAYLALSLNHIRKREPFVCLNDVAGASGLDARQRKRISDYAKEHDDELARYVKGAATVSKSSIIRAMITAMHWLAPPPHPYATFSTIEEAEAWLRQRARDAGFTLR